MPTKTAEEILKKLRVRSGYQPTTYVYSSHPEPWVCVDFFYDKEHSAFALRLCWAQNTKTIHLQPEDVESKSKSHWMADKTFTITDTCITRVAPGLDSALAAAVAVTRSTQ